MSYLEKIELFLSEEDYEEKMRIQDNILEEFSKTLDSL